MLAASAADETELVWIESRRSWASSRGQTHLPPPAIERTVLVRVIDRGRLGAYQTSGDEVGELEAAVRLAVAASRACEPLPGLPHLPSSSDEAPAMPPLFDPELAALSPVGAQRTLGEMVQDREQAVLDWVSGRVVVANTRGLVQRAEVTAATLQVSCGRRPGAGSAAASSRSLAGLDAAAVFARARHRHARGAVAPLPAGAVPLLLSAEAAIELCRLLKDQAFSARAYQEGRSFLRQHLGVQVFDLALNLRDDATSPAGLPFPFDLEGTPKRPVDLVVAGTPRTLALSQRQAALMGLPATPHAVGGNDARPENLFLVPGTSSEEDLLRSVEGGLWVGRLDRLECFESQRFMVRAHGHGIRRVTGGELGEAVDDIVWEDSLLHAFSALLGVGDAPVLRATGSGVLGGTSCPALALREATGLSRAPDAPRAVG